MFMRKFDLEKIAIVMFYVHYERYNAHTNLIKISDSLAFVG